MDVCLLILLAPRVSAWASTAISPFPVTLTLTAR